MSKSLHDLVAYQRALDSVVVIYEVTSAFPREERYGLTSQLRRGSSSVCSQIAEGQGRLSYGVWRQFLSQARGSLFEIDAQCDAATRLGFLSEADLARVTRELRRTASALAGLIRWVRTQEAKAKRPHSATQQPSIPATQQPVNAAPQSIHSCPKATMPRNSSACPSLDVGLREELHARPDD
jgi:four helix bundle protein